MLKAEKKPRQTIYRDRCRRRAWRRIRFMPEPTKVSGGAWCTLGKCRRRWQRQRTDQRTAASSLFSYYQHYYYFIFFLLLSFSISCLFDISTAQLSSCILLLLVVISSFLNIYFHLRHLLQTNSDSANVMPSGPIALGLGSFW